MLKNTFGQFAAVGLLVSLSAITLACGSKGSKANRSAGATPIDSAQDTKDNDHQDDTSGGSKDDGDTSVTQNETPSPKPSPSSGAASLTGIWIRCLPSSNQILKSTLLTLEISASTMKFASSDHTDAQCSKAATTADFQKYIAEIKKEYEAAGVTLTAAETAAMLKSLQQGRGFSAGLKVGKTLANGDVEIDVTHQGSEAEYLVYRITGNNLYLSKSCSVDMMAKQICTKEQGTSAANRATSDFSDAYSKKP